MPSVPGAGALPPSGPDSPPGLGSASGASPSGADPGGASGGSASRGPSAGGGSGAAGAVGARPDGGPADRAAGASGSIGGGSGAAVDAAGDQTKDAPSARAPRAGEVVIDELLVDPAGNDLGHEWIELANVASEALDLSALRVADEATEIAVDAGVLAAGGLLVLGQSIDRAHNGDAPVDLAYGTKLSLNNGADRIEICAGACAGGVVLDSVAWTAAWGDAYVGHAVVVERTGATCPATEAYGSGGNFGTPGRENQPCPADAGADGAGAPDAPGEH
ncbi:MAG TPA: lamin tail domain-containing protein [Polyangia bacterium]|nr:lamin tail domain-containing protein [Polyangia bacterium]